jgi:hypothetical protein
MIIKIQSESIDKVVNYLSTRPWREVEGLIHEISDQVNPQLQPQSALPTPPTPPEELKKEEKKEKV